MIVKQVYIDELGCTNVRLIPDGNFWWCEGVDWDYGAQGDTRDQALINFKRGFERTIELNIKKFGKFDKSKWKRGISVKVPDSIFQRIKCPGIGFVS